MKVGWKLGIYSFKFVMTHKLLLLLPLLSVLAMVGACFSVYWFTRGVANDIQSMALIFGAFGLGYFTCLFIAIFFNVVLIAMVNRYLEQKRASFIEGLSCALNRVPVILVWALITGSVGILIRLLNVIEEKFYIPSIISSILGMGWAAATYFVVPIICFQGSTDPSSLYHGSAKLISQAWGEGVIKIMGASLFSTVLFIPLFLAFIMLCNTSSAYHYQLFIMLGIISLFAFAGIMNGTLQKLFYKYADAQYIPNALQDAKHQRSATQHDEGFQRERIVILSLWCKRKLSFRLAYKQDYTARVIFLISYLQLRAVYSTRFQC